MLPPAALLRTDNPEERSSSIIRIVPSSLILVTMIMECYDPPKRRLIKKPHGAISQKTAFFIVAAVKTSNLT
jgi:hypothetical protein